jgi:hypothetical protein
MNNDKLREVLRKIIRSQSGRYDPEISIRYCGSLIEDLVPIVEKGLQATAKEMAIEYGCYYADEDELKTRIDECVAVGITEMTEG